MRTGNNFSARWEIGAGLKGNSPVPTVHSLIISWEMGEAQQSNTNSPPDHLLGIKGNVWLRCGEEVWF